MNTSEAAGRRIQSPACRVRNWQNKENHRMKFADFISRDAIRAELTAEDKEAVIREMVQSLVTAGKIETGEAENIVKAILKREELGSTGIGRGVAVPHAKHPSVDRLVGTVAVSHEGVDFNSLDGERVQLFFLLISPPDRPGDHLRALENISRQLRDDTFCRFLKKARSAEEIEQLLDEADNNQFVA
jgi:fructose-specific phosphotransferase system IIA component